MAQIHSLAEKHSYSYHEIAEKLNREGVHTAFGRTFTHMHVGYICRRDGVTRKNREDKPNPNGDSNGINDLQES